MTRCTDASVYREAARLLESDAPNGFGNLGSAYSCDRLGQAAGWFGQYPTDAKRQKFKALRHRYANVFQPSDRMVWWTHGKSGHDARVLALCFMAAMVEAGDA